jgi:hypothetical protein
VRQGFAKGAKETVGQNSTCTTTCLRRFTNASVYEL